MKFVQLIAVYWSKGKGNSGYTLYRMSEEGDVYKSIPKGDSAQHHGWLKLKSEEIPEDFFAKESVVKANRRMGDCVDAVARTKKRLAVSFLDLAKAKAAIEPDKSKAAHS